MKAPTETLRLHELIGEAREAIKDCDVAFDSYKKTQKAYWARLIGDSLDQLLSSKSTTRQWLPSPVAEHRVAAIEILTFHWKLDDDDKLRLTEVSRQDSDPRVRAVAASALTHSAHLV